MLVGDQLTVDGKPAPRQGSGGRRRAAARRPRGARGGAAGRGAEARRRAAAGRPEIPRCARRATARYSSAPRATWPPRRAARACGCCPASRWAEYKLPPQLLQRGINHQQDWIRACKGGAPGVSEFAVASKYIEWLALGAIALRVPGKLMWDAKNMRFTNSEEANKLLKPFLRKGWELKL